MEIAVSALDFASQSVIIVIIIIHKFLYRHKVVTSEAVIGWFMHSVVHVCYIFMEYCNDVRHVMMHRSPCVELDSFSASK